MPWTLGFPPWPQPCYGECSDGVWVGGWVGGGGPRVVAGTPPSCPVFGLYAQKCVLCGVCMCVRV